MLVTLSGAEAAELRFPAQTSFYCNIRKNDTVLIMVKFWKPQMPVCTKVPDPCAEPCRWVLSSLGCARWVKTPGPAQEEGPVHLFWARCCSFFLADSFSPIPSLGPLLPWRPYKGQTGATAPRIRCSDTFFAALSIKLHSRSV